MTSSNPDTPRSAEEPMNVLTAEWRIADATDEEGRHRIVWEDDTPDAWVWEVCADMTSDAAKHIVELHNATLSTPTTPVPTEEQQVQEQLEDAFRAGWSNGFLTHQEENEDVVMARDWKAYVATLPPARDA